MSSPCNFMDHYEWTSEQRVAVMQVERALLKRQHQTQGLVPYHAAKLSPPAPPVAALPLVGEGGAGNFIPMEAV